MGNLVAVVLLPILFSACIKENTEPAKAECELKKYGSITVSNNSKNPYDVYIDGVVVIQLAGGTISTPIKINEGNGRKLYAKQVSGYLLYPTEKSADFNVISCSDYSWQIP